MIKGGNSLDILYLAEKLKSPNSDETGILWEILLVDDYSYEIDVQP